MRGAQEWELADGLGSTTGIADGSRTVVGTYQYDAFGAVRAQTGSSPNEFTFTGEQVDATGMQYLRARYYDPTTGRFLGRDPVPYLQRYAYVFNNPVNLTDPSGMRPEGLQAELNAAFDAALACIYGAVYDGNLDPCKPLLAQIEALLEGGGDLIRAVGAAGLNALDWAVDRTNQVLDAIEGWCAQRDCVQVALATAGLTLAIVGIFASSPVLGPLLIAVGLTLYAVQFQYTWNQYMEGDADFSDLLNSAFLGAPMLVSNKKVSQLLDVLFSALEVIRETLCPQGCTSLGAVGTGAPHAPLSPGSMIPISMRGSSR